MAPFFVPVDSPFIHSNFNLSNMTTLPWWQQPLKHIPNANKTSAATLYGHVINSWKKQTLFIVEGYKTWLTAHHWSLLLFVFCLLIFWLCYVLLQCVTYILQWACFFLLKCDTTRKSRHHITPLPPNNGPPLYDYNGHFPLPPRWPWGERQV